MSASAWHPPVPEGDPIEAHCAFKGCDRQRQGRKGYCHAHYEQIRSGRPLTPIKKQIPRGASMVELVAALAVEPTGCRRWTTFGSVNQFGYASIVLNGQRIYVHRASYEAHVGPIPDGLQIDHVWARGCRFHDCVEPSHLEPVTHQENHRRGARARQTHCIHGHEYTPENTYRSPGNGRRKCRACGSIEKFRRRTGPAPAKTHCPQGHAYDEANTYNNPQGRRECRTCRKRRRAAA